jgi:hypothetical protein
MGEQLKYYDAGAKDNPAFLKSLVEVRHIGFMNAGTITGFGRGRGNASPLKLADFTALAVDLGAHSFDFGS